MKRTRKSARYRGNRTFIFDSAKLGILHETSTRYFVNFLFNAEDRTIAHSWISCRPPDAFDVQDELTRFVSE